MSVWPQVPAGEVLELVRHPAEMLPTGEYTQIGIRSFGKGLFRYSPAPPAGLSKMRYFSFPPAALAVSNIKAWEGAIAVSPHDADSLVASNRFLFYLPRDRDRVDVDFVRSFLLSEIGLQRVGQASPGSADRNRTLSQKGFERLMIPLPPLDEQRRIAARMRCFDASTRRLSSYQSSTRDTGEALSASALSAWYERWCSQPLRLGVDIPIVSGGTPDTTNGEFWGDECPWITPADLGRQRGQDEIARGSRSLSKSGLAELGGRLVPKGGIVMSSRAPIGYLAIADEPLSTNQGCKSFPTPDGVDPKLFLWVFRAVLADILAASSGSTFQEVSNRRLHGIELRLPGLREKGRALSEIDEVARRLNRVHALRSKSEELVKVAPAAALNEVFRGRV